MDFGSHVSLLRLSEFDTADIGIGVDAAWQATPVFALDGAFTWFPASGTAALASRIAKQERLLGLVGVRSGIRRGPLEIVGRTRVGVLRFSPLDQAVCIAITTVPLPLDCQLAAGYTAFATDIGGGISIATTDRLQLHVEAGDLMVRYGLEAYRTNGQPTEGFTSHNLQVSFGLRWRF